HARRDHRQRRHHVPGAVVRDRPMMDSIGPIRVLVLETEPQIIANARAALEGDNRLVLVGAVNDQASLLDKLGSTYAHVAVIDIAGLNGDEGTWVRRLYAHTTQRWGS